jgi:5-dehydro-2-deoxygluconokinase
MKGTTMTIGYDKPLYVLPFDHRATFAKTMFGWPGPLSPEQTAEITAVKQVIFDAFKAAVAGGVPKGRAGILVDEQFGAAILREASAAGFITACTVEIYAESFKDQAHLETLVGEARQMVDKALAGS